MTRLDVTALDDRHSVSVVVPMYNEAPSLAANLSRLQGILETRKESYDFNYVLIDDGSSDDTYAIAQRFAAGRSDVTLLRHDVNKGLGGALATARDTVRGTYTLTIDADLSYDPAFFLTMLDAAVDENADLVLASAYMKGGKVRNVPWRRALLSREANRFLSMAANGKVATLTCVVRVYRSVAFRALAFTTTGMDVNAVLLLQAVRKRFTIVELPALLDWGEGRPGSRGSLRSICALTWRTLHCGFSYRPSLLLAIPGLVPGLLPLVVAVLYFMHLSAANIAFWSFVTVVIQYSSLALFAGQAVTFIHRRRMTNRLAPSTAHRYKGVVS